MDGGAHIYKNITQTLQVAFTYMGTVVGAGFATGQEILHFYTRFGSFATWTIAATTGLIIWLGCKIMLIANQIGAESYEDLNRYLFGDRIGWWVSFVSMINLFGICAVMLAGGGSVLYEQLGLPYNIGLALTMMLAFILLMKGINSIMIVNSIVVPVMLTYSLIVVLVTVQMPEASNFITLTSDYSILKTWVYAFLYVAGNLALAQAVLVPLGSTIKNRSVIYWGGILGGGGIGLMLMAGHFALSAHMPGISRFEIPMGYTVSTLGSVIQLLVIFVIFAEIFTTLLSDVYGLTLQIRQHTGWNQPLLIALILIASYSISQIGFSTLLTSLYPLFGLISLIWLAMMLAKHAIGARE